MVDTTKAALREAADTYVRRLLEQVGGHIGLLSIFDDVATETRVAIHPLVAELDIRAYAGWQVTGAGGETLGVLCAMDDRPRRWTTGELTALTDLAQACGPTVRAAVARRAG